LNFGASEYLEDLISRIESPRLNQIDIEYSDQPSDFQVAQLFRFIDSSEDPKLALIRRACINILTPQITLVLDPGSGYHPDQSRVNISTPYYWFGEDNDNSYLAKLFGQPSALLSRVVHLEFYQYRGFQDLVQDRRNDGWLHILRQFSATRTLLISVDSAGDNAFTLEDVTGEIKILPVLDLICIDSHDQPVSYIEKFLAARRLSGRPVTIIKSHAEFFDRVDSYVVE
jgi:hypothetical protein